MTEDVKKRNLWPVTQTLMAPNKRGAYKEGSKAQVIAEIEAGVPRSKAPGCAKVTRQTFYNWLESDPDFAREVEFAEARLTKRRLEAVEAEALVEYKDRGDTKTMYRLLEVAASEFRSGPDTQINIGQIGNNLVVQSDERISSFQKLRQAATARMSGKGIIMEGETTSLDSISKSLQGVEEGKGTNKEAR